MEAMEAMAGTATTKEAMVGSATTKVDTTTTSTTKAKAVGIETIKGHILDMPTTIKGDTVAVLVVVVAVTALIKVVFFTCLFLHFPVGVKKGLDGRKGLVMYDYYPGGCQFFSHLHRFSIKNLPKLDESREFLRKWK